MSELAGSKTEGNLKEAFAGESQANRRYLAFAKQADAEGFPQVAKLFRAAAEAEAVHAHAHLRAMGGVRSAKENLEAAIGRETHEFKTMYPGMIAGAEEEGFKKGWRVQGFADVVEEEYVELFMTARRSFDYANQVEEIHVGLFQRALDSLGQEVEAFDT